MRAVLAEYPRQFQRQLPRRVTQTWPLAAYLWMNPLRFRSILLVHD